MADKMSYAAELVDAVEPQAGVTPGEWQPVQYLLVLGLLAAVGGGVLAVGVMTKAVLVCAIIAAIPVTLLTLWKPEIGLYVLLLMIPFENYTDVGNFTVVKALGLFTFAAFMAHTVRGRPLALGNVTFWCFLAFGAWSVLSVVGALSAEEGLSSLLKRFQMIGLVLLVLSLHRSYPQSLTLWWVMVLGAVAAGFAGFFLTPETEYESRTTLGPADVNAYGKDLMPAVFLMPFFFMRTRGPVRWLLPAGLLVVLIALVGTGSRSGYAAMLAGVIVATLTFRRLRLGGRVLLVGGVLGVLALFVLIGAVSGVWDTSLFGRVTDLGERGLTIGSRLDVWKGAVQLGLEHPVFGVGAGNYIFAALTQTVSLKAVHNDFLQNLAETGFPGFFLYCAFLGSALWYAWRTPDLWLRAGLIGCLTAAVVASMGNPSYMQKGFFVQVAMAALGGIVVGTPQASAPSARGDMVQPSWEASEGR